MKFSARSIGTALLALVFSAALGWAVTITGTNNSNKNMVFEVGFLRVSTTDSITALAGGAQAGTALTSAFNRVTTVASANDSVQLPACRNSGATAQNTIGTVIYVVNAAAANSMNVYPQTGDFINALSVNSAYAVAANKTVEFICGTATISAGTWYSVLGG